MDAMEVNPYEDFDGYYLLNGVEWTVSKDWKKGVNVGFCVTAEGANPHCYAQQFSYTLGSYSASLSAANNFAERPAVIDNGVYTSSEWTTPSTSGLYASVGIWQVEGEAGNPAADPATPFTTEAMFAQVRESVSSANYFRFSPGTVQVHVFNSAAGAEWQTADYQLTGAASLAAGVVAAAATLLF